MRVDYTKLYQAPVKIEHNEVEKDRYLYKNININPINSDINAFLMAQDCLLIPKSILNKLEIPVENNLNLFMSKCMVIRFHKLPTSYFTDKECFVIAMNIAHYTKQSTYLNESHFLKFINQGIDKAQTKELKAQMFMYKGLYYFEQFQFFKLCTKFKKNACLAIAKYNLLEAIKCGVNSLLAYVCLSMIFAFDKQNELCLKTLESSRRIESNKLIEELIIKSKRLISSENRVLDQLKFNNSF